MATTYYRDQGEAYLAQRASSASDYNQSLRASLFQNIASPHLTVLDFGCGTGGVIARVPASKRIGIELGEEARILAEAKGVKTHTSLSAVPDATVDLAISYHALEHVDSPVEIMIELRRVLKLGGYLRVVVPAEHPLLKKQRQWCENRDKHLYTWTPLLLGNLAERAGFSDIRTHSALPPSQSRASRLLRPMPLLAKAYGLYIAIRDNSLNTILDARVV